ncbi:MAG: DUF4058 family protein [Planctomycetia bacterium]|nr:DUF4058 family protein [Planctomycetia bacterium]
MAPAQRAAEAKTVMQVNPFPGMNPWLESHWGDIHTSLSTYARDQLQPQLLAGLRARVEVYVAVESDDDEGRGVRFAPDGRIVERPNAPFSTGGGAAAVAEVAEPVMISRLVEPETLHRIEIVDSADGHRIVSSIEFLNLANKVGDEGRDRYLAKQEQMLTGNVNLIEIDLLRDGAWVLAAPESEAPKRCRGPYRICVVPGHRQNVAAMYPVSLRQPLPTIGIPLRPQDRDVLLRLQPLLDVAYVNGRYHEDLDYRQDPKPPLTGTDAEWADQLLREKGLR